MPENKDELKTSIKELPEKPGVYKFFDSSEQIIYVGKAKNLKKRVSSYFNKVSGHDNKTKRLVNKIIKVEFTIVNSEFDAYLLENSLIKANKPKFNILLRDDKTYPYLYISHERFPKLISTRKLNKDLGTFYGPYTSVKAMNAVVELVSKIFAIRTCSLNLSQKNIEDKKFKICLEYHIGNCKGPCEGLVAENEYNNNIDQVHNILKGNLGIVKQFFRENMTQSSANLEFEKAQLFKDKLELLEKFQANTVIVHPKISNLDVITIASTSEIAVVNFLSITNGIISKTKTVEVKKKLDEPDEEVILTSLISIKLDLESDNKEVLTNISIDTNIDNNILIGQPKIGDKKKLVELSYKNALFELRKLKEKSEHKIPFEHTIMETLQKDLQLKKLPERIECFDNSNIQGTNPVAAMVSFIKARPSKKDYRHYNIKTVTGPDDFASMTEIVGRRYRRLIDENSPLPDLIIIDGGKGQLNAACQALRELGLYGSIPIIGIAKRLEEIYYPEDQFPLYLDKKSISLKLIQQIRDEAHRFAITFHRKKRSLATLTSSINEIPGMGPKTYQKLIREFKSLTGIKEAKLDDLERLIGKAKAIKLKKYLNPPKPEEI